MNGKNRIYIGHFMIRLALILLCMTAFSTSMLSGLYARYTTTSSGQDSARVAKFDISENATSFQSEFTIDAVPGTVEREILVTNNSEVAVGYKVTIQNKTGNIPYAFSVNGSEPVQKKCVVTCYIEPNTESTVTITAFWDPEGALEYMGMVDLVEILIEAHQVD